jgi:hypothetical protein
MKIRRTCDGEMRIGSGLTMIEHISEAFHPAARCLRAERAWKRFY